MANHIVGIGHNSGRVDEPGKSWRTHAWAKARRRLMPNLPIEVIRRRVARAKELGLPYKSYAGLRASSGDDLIGFMFSSNALGIRPRTDLSADKVAKLSDLRDAVTIGMAQAPVEPDRLVPPMDHAFRAPRPLAPWAQTRDALCRVFAQTRRPAGRFVLVCDTALESEWAEVGRMAGVLPAAIYFGNRP